METAPTRPEAKSEAAAAAPEAVKDGKAGADKAGVASEAMTADDKARAGKADEDIVPSAASAPKKQRVILHVMEKSEHEKEVHALLQ